MKIVIDIPKKTYNEIKERTIVTCGEIFAKNLVRRIRNGTPLPEHHGRLIDADEFHQILEDMTIRDNDKWFNWLQRACIRLGEMPTIIEGSDADAKESKSND